MLIYWHYIFSENYIFVPDNPPKLHFAVEDGLEALGEVQVREGEQWYSLRTALQGVSGKVLQSVGVAVPPSIRPVSL